MELDHTPSDIDVMRALSFHNAARIYAGIVYPRARKNEFWEEQHRANVAPPAAPEAIMLHAPTDPTRNVSGEMVNIGKALDGRSEREVPLLDDSVLNRGLELYKRYCWDEPSEDIRPSLAQFTAVMAAKAMKSMYFDAAHFAPHDTRTAKSRKHEGLIVGTDGLLCKQEQKGPPDFPTCLECMRVHECAGIMAGMFTPPSIDHFIKKMIKYDLRFGESYPLWYQQYDRWTHVQVPELLRKEMQKYDRQIDGGDWYPRITSEDGESVLDPECPYDHLLHLCTRHGTKPLVAREFHLARRQGYHEDQEARRLC